MDCAQSGSENDHGLHLKNPSGGQHRGDLGNLHSGIPRFSSGVRSSNSFFDDNPAWEEECVVWAIIEVGGRRRSAEKGGLEAGDERRSSLSLNDENGSSDDKIGSYSCAVDEKWVILFNGN